MSFPEDLFNVVKERIVVIEPPSQVRKGPRRVGSEFRFPVLISAPMRVAASHQDNLLTETSKLLLGNAELCENLVK